jgi:UTP--glucose-1-phosphate uridylyltransferase
MYALTGGAPKELLPLAGVALVEWVVRECAASGASEVLVVTAPGKDAIRERLAPRVGAPGFPVRIDFIEQSAPTGLIDAVRLGREFAADAPLAVALPDNLFVGDAPGLAQVIETYYRTGQNVVALIPARDASDTTRVGATMYRGERHGDDVAIRGLLDGRVPAARGADETRDLYASVGRFVLTEEVWPLLDAATAAAARTAGAHPDAGPVLQHVLDAARLVGRCVRGEFLDVGDPTGYDEAVRLIRRPPRLSAPTGELA